MVPGRAGDRPCVPSATSDPQASDELPRGVGNGAVVT